MYAVVQTGGKQYRVSQGQTFQVERVEVPGSTISLHPVLLVDEDKVLTHPSELASVQVSALVVSEDKGSKIRGFTYKPKSNQRRRWGHRQILSTIQITSIDVNAPASLDDEAVEVPEVV
ncbi:MAG: 50S ribosomal protein L21 [Acidimicrobiaceae bacterium]|nr:50S ribosomal protein L21 [Acidimicrobiaceae bacterium]